nr:hypothetical protein [Clostridium botulinum]
MYHDSTATSICIFIVIAVAVDGILSDFLSPYAKAPVEVVYSRPSSR